MASIASVGAAAAVVTAVINGSSVPVTGEAGVDVRVAIESTAFIGWARTLDPALAVSAVHVQSVDMFGRRVGFLKFKCDAEHHGKPIPGIVFARGGSVAVLVLLRAADGAGPCVRAMRLRIPCMRAHSTYASPVCRYVLLVRQPRLPIGARAFPEIPAGMIDDSGSFAGVAAREMEEETGLRLEARDAHMDVPCGRPIRRMHIHMRRRATSRT